MKATQFKNAKEYSSPRWAFMKRRLIGSGDDIYLDRTYILQTPWFGIMFHRIFRPDNQRDLHDHPWNFLSFILRGHYIEDTVDGPRRRGWLNWKRAEDRHSIREVSRSPIWTLVFTGRKRRTWGFWVPAITLCCCEDTKHGHEFGCVARYEPERTIFVKWTDYAKVNEP